MLKSCKYTICTVSECESGTLKQAQTSVSLNGAAIPQLSGYNELWDISACMVCASGLSGKLRTTK